MSSSCVFCRIAAGEIPARVVHRDDRAIAFHDASPQAPVHLLVIPRRHLEHLLDADAADPALAGHLIALAVRLARELGLDKSGFRIVFNTLDDGGQSVSHLHLHLLGGRALGWPPG